MAITADEIRQIRRDLEMSQSQFAARLNRIDPNLSLDTGSISRYENDKVTPGAHVEQAMRRAAWAADPDQAGGRNPNGVDRYQLADLIRDRGVNAVGLMVDDMAEQIVPALRDGINLLGWEVMSAPSGVAVAFVRREKTPQGLAPEVLTLRAERSSLEDDIRTRYTRHRGSNVDREDWTVAAERRVTAINTRLREIDPAEVANQIVMLQRMPEDPERRERIDRLEAQYEALKPSVNPPVEGVLWINDEAINRATWAHHIEDAGYPMILMFRDESKVPV